MIYAKEGRREEARLEFQQAIAMFDKTVPAGDSRLEIALTGYARLLKTDRGRRQEARQIEQRAKAVHAMALRGAQ